jgi:replication factor C subunit 3/5
MLWLDKHRPKRLSKMDYHKDLSDRLSQLCATGDVPHLIFYGPSGAGKKTRVHALLRELFGPGVAKTKVEHLSHKTPSGKKVEISVLGSNYHTEMNPADAGFHDRVVVQEVIKGMAQYRSLGVGQMLSGASGGAGAASGASASTEKSKRPSYKVLVLTEVDRLSRDAQHALRRTMEKYAASCRLILICNSLCSVIEPVRSRCLAVRVPAPSEEELCSVLSEVARREQLRLPPALAQRVSQASERNVRVALLSLEACKVQSYPFTDATPVAMADWRQFIARMAQDILQQQSPQRLLDVRKKLYELLINCIPAQTILRELTLELLKKCDADLKGDVCRWAAHYSHNLQRGSKEIFHLEAFVAQFMSLYKSFLLDLGF